MTRPSDAASREALYRVLHADPAIPHHDKVDRCFAIADRLIAAGYALSAPDAAVDARQALTPLRGYPTDGVSHDRHWVRDPNGAYVGFEDAVDALAAIRAAEPPALNVEIRGTHWAQFRSGAWAVLVGVHWTNERACYSVRFPDGATDSWVIEDPSETYEFRARLSDSEPRIPHGETE